MAATRSNQDWLRDLNSSGAPQAAAIADLRELLLRAALYHFSRNLGDFGGLSRDEILHQAEDCAQDALIGVLDHLGSTSLTANASGAKVSELRYDPWGEIRYAWSTTNTSFRYTGQRSEGIGLYDYRTRFYDPALGRFAQADSIIPGQNNVQAWDRYAYVNR